VATHDYDIANGTGAAVRSDINGALAAIVSNNSNASAPATTYAYMLWADTTAGQMKMRNGANSAWVTLWELDGTLLATDISLGLGTVSAPSLFFTGDPNTGIYSPGADTIAFVEGGVESMRIDSAGKLLIGTNTSTGSSRLVVQGNSTDGLEAFSELKYGAANAPGNGAVGRFSFSDQTNNTFYARMGVFADGTPTASSKPGRISFATTSTGSITPTSRMAILQDGKVGIGTNVTPNKCFTVTSFGSTDVVEFNNADASATNTNLVLSTTRAAGTASFYVYGTANSVNTLIVYNNGNIQNTNNSYGAISDIKLKENVVDAASQWEDLKALQVRKYNFKEGQTHTQIGLIAQEVELVSPGLVSESADRENIEVPVLDDKGKPVLDENGKPLIRTEVRLTGTVTKNVNYSVLYMKAVKALQEAMERIETLEAKVAALEAN